MFLQFLYALSFKHMWLWWCCCCMKRSSLNLLMCAFECNWFASSVCAALHINTNVLFVVSLIFNSCFWFVCICKYLFNLCMHVREFYKVLFTCVCMRDQRIETCFFSSSFRMTFKVHIFIFMLLFIYKTYMYTQTHSHVSYRTCASSPCISKWHARIFVAFVYKTKWTSLSIWKRKTTN